MFLWLTKIKNNFSQLSANGRRLLLSFFLFALACPMIDLFTSFFLWRNGKSVSLLALYYISIFFVGTVGFFVNGLLLKYLSPVKLYALGSIVQGLAPFALIFFNAVSLWQVLLAGSLLGLARGFFWGNRHILTDEITKKESRVIFIDAENIVYSFAGILTPLAVGWFLVFGTNSGLYSTDTAYQCMAIAELILLISAGLVIKSLPVKSYPQQHIILRQWQPLWSAERNATLLSGMESGVAMMVPTLLILEFFGKENSAGALSSSLALIATIVMCLAAKWKSPQVRISMLRWWIMTSVLATGIVMQFFSSTGVWIYFVILAATNGFRFTGEMSIAYDVIDLDEPEKRYAYLCDRETYLNVGRVLSLAAFVICYQFFPESVIGSFLIMRLVLKTAFYFQNKYIHNALLGMVDEKLVLATVPVNTK